MYRLTDYEAMLEDRRRIDAWTRALTAAIRPGSIVLDLGSGLGTFSILACRLGASRVYSVEPNDVIEVARAHAIAGGVDDRIQFLRARAMDIELPERVDVILSDLSGALPLFEENLPSVMYARDSFLKPGGVLIPQCDRLMWAPVSGEGLYVPLQTAHPLYVEPEDLAGKPQCWAELDYATLTSPNVRATVEWPGEAHSIALWFESTLLGDITYSSGPWHPDSVHSTMVLPLPEPGARQLTIDATLADGQYLVTWGTGRILQRRIEDDLVLLDRASGAYHRLNETGARVWEALRRGDDPNAIAAAIANDYDVDPRRASEDVAAVITELKVSDLIE